MNRFLPLSAAIALALGTATAFAANGDSPVDQSTDQGGSISQPSFDQIDTNGDGVISREEAAAAGLNLDWSSADKDGSGSLSRDEYQSAVSGTGTNGTSPNGGFGIDSGGGVGSGTYNGGTDQSGGGTSGSGGMGGSSGGMGSGTGGTGGADQ